MTDTSYEPPCIGDVIAGTREGVLLRQLATDHGLKGALNGTNTWGAEINWTTTESMVWNRPYSYSVIPVRVFITNTELVARRLVK